MSGRVIQGFFVGGRAPAGDALVWPAGPVVQARMAVAQSGATVANPRPGPPSLAHMQRPGDAPPGRGAVQRMPTGGAGTPQHRPAAIQRHGGDGSRFEVDPVRLGLAQGGGQPLPGPLLAKMEAALGADFSAVRVHVGPQAARVGALAFTTGNDLYFAPGRYQPDTVPGQQLIGHELAHVIQQRQGRVRGSGGGVTVVQDRALEAEADRLGLAAARTARPAAARVVQRAGAPVRPQHRNPAGNRVIQRVVAAAYVAAGGSPVYASATITFADLNTGTAASVAAAAIPSHMGNAHPYHHERGHLIARCLGGDGASANNLVGLSDATNGALMYDMEGTVYDIIHAAGAGASVFMEVTVDYSATHYNGPAAAPYVAGMVGSLEITVYDAPGGAVLFSQRYPNGVVKNHPAAGCC